MIISVVGIVLVAVFSNTCNNMHKMAINETDLLNSTTYSGHMLGHIHRGGSCTEKSTTSGYIVSTILLPPSCPVPACLPPYLPPLPPSLPPSLRHYYTVLYHMPCLKSPTRSGALRNTIVQLFQTVFVSLVTWVSTLWLGFGHCSLYSTTPE